MRLSSTIGSLLHVMTRTRSNISHAVGDVNRCMSNLSENQRNRFNFVFQKSRFELRSYVGDDIVGILITEKYYWICIHFGWYTTVSWVSKLPTIVSLFITKAEYVVVIEASKEIIRLQFFLNE